ncbi:L,D-transpeptidase [Jannaschia sp. Os4]|uniref:L,D-transpeptidase n=1 Tax=Jannaschia sp. Os4 TaxID=2807617 RepID=UPI00193993BA|nr:L,D-transpeptidase [Jannaschia sp. Os4]MBM2578116.1 L,D-transpeptidase [Jannaschia sp. Os4]
MQRREFLTTGLASGLALTGLFAADAARAQSARGPSFDPVLVRTRADVAANELHVLPDAFMVYWTMPGGVAMRYRCGVGRPGLYESGEFYVGAKKEWPSWTPTPEMIERDPASYAQYADGVPGGPDNPLGARAIYLFQEGRGDTFLRIHGTNAPGTIGSAVSNGCARLINSEIIDLYERVAMRARVVLHPKANGSA